MLSLPGLILLDDRCSAAFEFCRLLSFSPSDVPTQSVEPPWCFWKPYELVAQWSFWRQPSFRLQTMLVKVIRKRGLTLFLLSSILYRVFSRLPSTLATRRGHLPPTSCHGVGSEQPSLILPLKELIITEGRIGFSSFDRPFFVDHAIIITGSL